MTLSAAPGTQSRTAVTFTKGHGTENDFVIIADPSADFHLTPDDVAALCDRRAGIGADGLLRVVRSGALVDSGEIHALPEGVDDQDWFMDYRNADGSIAEMCGNGVRVFAHYLAVHDLLPATDETFVIGTRAGRRAVRIHHADNERGTVAVGMGTVEVSGVSTATMGEFSFAGLGVNVGNPHLAAVIPGMRRAQLAEFALESPEFDQEFFPDGVNVEVLTELDNTDMSVDMRVFERGVGETRSCGTGTVAAARAALADAGIEDGDVTVRVPGGEVTVALRNDEATLTGPSRLVYSGEIDLDALTSASGVD